MFQYDLKDIEKMYMSGGLSKKKIEIEYRTELNKIYVVVESLC